MLGDICCFLFFVVAVVTSSSYRWKIMFPSSSSTNQRQNLLEKMMHSIYLNGDFKELSLDIQTPPEKVFGPQKHT